ncbi:Demethylrebeccamycin-D-glucose O-methyltransferase [Luteitalea pratensis]|jgi:SAM-dependent methyltransferase|uniref:Demethylrebeccamycin-D-glucose O-methyltransferase n=1 Tax=Luteitalea pratensis TaxID=1855912 RepID=A0A143PRQ5_LUTPR|nr:class I SAM-dependent methyltransferase [Luteitalea pratensis]AMY10863.1 Demethylrebeccamycin-D-glucose O-methyltransferase [Luteitalea pratensis]
MLALMFTYDFDYSWPLRWGHVLLSLAGVALALLGWRFGWRRWRIVASGLLCLWGAAGAIAMHYAVQIASPQRLATESFIPAGRGEVLELGAGSGRATIGLLFARPQARVTALDAYRGYFGIEDNTPERLMRNARAAGVADRVHVQVADMRRLPFEAGRFDAVFSVAAIDHLPWDGIAQALTETARVLRPGGQLLIVSLNSDAWIKVAMPWSLHGHGFWSSTQNRRRWTEALGAAGFTLVETGTRPATIYFLAKSAEPHAAQR